jgi:cephalosporin-C deacetylase-like acetyl esterase
MHREFVTVYTVPHVSNQGYTLTVQPCQEGVHFERNRPIRFQAILTRDGRPCSDGELYAYFKWNSEKVIWYGFLDLVDGKASLEFTCEQSGFGNLHVLYYRDGQEIVEQLRGIAISPDLLERSYPCPVDFDAFWTAKKKAIEAVPIEARYTPITRDSHPHLHSYSHKSLLEKDIAGVEICDVQVSCLPKGVSGILTMPKNSPQRSLPAVLVVHGHGVRPCDPGQHVEQAARGLMIYDMNAHGIPNDKPEAWYRDLAEHGELAHYDHQGRQSRETYYFLNMFLRVKRGLDFLMSRPEWDGQVLVTMGCSQGAAQAYAGAYLEDRVSAVVGYSPAYGDLTGFLRGRTVNWPEWLHMGPRGQVDKRILEVAPYFDGVNFLRRYDRDVCCALGLLDQGCLPTTNYGPISQCPASATVILQSDKYHQVSKQAEVLLWDFVSEHVSRSKKADLHGIP